MKRIKPALVAFLVALSAAASPAARAASSYDQVILHDQPVLFLSMSAPGSGSELDLSGHGNTGVYQGGNPAAAALPNGEAAALFDGARQYLTVASVPALSVPTNGALTVESWIRPSTLEFPNTEAEGYVYFLGKGDPGHGYEYANRMYSFSNSAGRPNRISDYAWNTSGGLGSGSYFQDSVAAGQWIMVTDVIDTRSATISIYKNGTWRGTVPLSQYNVTPGATDAPFNVGTRNANSWFAGAIGKVAVYPRVLTSAQIAAHYTAMTSAPPPPPTQNTTPAALPEFRAAQRFLSPASSDGVNDSAVFGPGAARVTIYDLRGRRVFDERRGATAISWNGRDSGGRLVESGPYIARIVTDDGRTGFQSFAVAK